MLAIAAGTLPGEHFLLENFLVEQFVGVHRAVWAVAGLALEAEAEQPPQCGRGGHRGSCTHNKYKIKLSEKSEKKIFRSWRDISEGWQVSKACNLLQPVCDRQKKSGSSVTESKTILHTGT